MQNKEKDLENSRTQIRCYYNSQGTRWYDKLMGDCKIHKNNHHITGVLKWFLRLYEGLSTEKFQIALGIPLQKNRDMKKDVQSLTNKEKPLIEYFTSFF